MKVFKYITILAFLIGAQACSDFGDVNVDPKSPLEAESAFLFTSATKAFMDFYTDANVNENISRLAAQYWSQVTYTSESRYDWDSRQISDNVWAQVYRNFLTDMKEARALNASEVDPVAKANKDGIITTMEVLAYQLLVDLFGDIPYSEALDAENNPSPAYDDGAAIYDDLIGKLDAAIAAMDGSGSGYGDADGFYHGNVENWIKLANSLKVRIGIRLADVNPGKAEGLIEAAAGNAISSNDENAMFSYLDGSVNGHPLYSTLVLSGRHDYVASNTLVDYMNALNDPRRDDYMTLDLATGSEYIGNVYGQAASVQFGDYSQVNPTLEAPTFPGQLMTYAETAFSLAEAAMRGWDVGGTAEEWYNIGVTASIMQWGGTQQEADDYLAQPEVAFATAEGGDGMKAIAMQKWLAFYDDGYQGWIEWKRLDYPVLNAPADPLDGLENIPVRHRYPTNEPSLNSANYAAAAAAIGGDELTTKVFWDIK